MLYTELQERKLVPERGIEPPSTDYETVVLPLYYAGKLEVDDGPIEVTSLVHLPTKHTTTVTSDFYAGVVDRAGIEPTLKAL